MNKRSNREGLAFVRVMMVISSFSPLFVLWAVRGTPVIPDWALAVICGALIFVPNAILSVRFRVARRQLDKRVIKITEAKDQREHFLVYLFAMLLPLYQVSSGSGRDILSVVIAFVLIIFMFWHLNLHYMNFWFALRGYRIFTVEPQLPHENGQQGVLGQTQTYIVLTKRSYLLSGQELEVLRLSDTVYIEE